MRERLKFNFDESTTIIELLQLALNLRLDESREISRYMISLLVFLGFLNFLKFLKFCFFENFPINPNFLIFWGIFGPKKSKNLD